MLMIHHYHPETGVYQGTTECDESPLEPGVYLIPASATHIAPPKVGDGQYAEWVDGAWAVKDIPVPEPDPGPAPVPEPTTEELYQLLRYARNHKLTECDWTQLPDAPLTDAKKAEWALYRQALRDFPANCTDPANPVWPEPPQ